MGEDMEFEIGTVYVIGKNGDKIEIGKLADIEVGFTNKTNLSDEVYIKAVGIIVGTGLISRIEAVSIVNQLSITVNGYLNFVEKIKETAESISYKPMEELYYDPSKSWERIWNVERNWTLKNKRFYGYGGGNNNLCYVARSLLNCKISLALVINILESMIWDYMREV